MQVGTTATGLYTSAEASKSFTIGKAPLSEIPAIEVESPFSNHLEASWDDLDYATGYEVTLLRNGRPLEGDEYNAKYTPHGRCSFDIDQPGTYAVMVKALPDANHVESLTTSDLEGLEFYQVKLDLADGTPEIPYYPYDGQLVAEGCTLDFLAKDPTREGFVFAGWRAPDGSAWDLESDAVKGPMTITAAWNPRSTPVEPIEGDSVRYLVQHY